MYEIIVSFAQFIPYVFMLLVVGMIWDSVFSAFSRGRL